jgi:UDP-N-acetylmuramyl pentapeptide phosphotransferase/UDP-N-acetylglucosamine-1-phosphate transferase
LADAGLPPALAGAVSLGLAGGAVLALRHLASRLPAALPTDRSLHDQPMPRVGGLAIWAGFLPVALASPPAAGIATTAWLVAWAAIAAVSLIDDWHGVRPLYRLIIHAAAALGVAGVILGAPGASLPRIVELVLLGLVITWSANLFNFMDGTDGLAALMAIAGFAAYAAAAALAGEPAQVYLALAAAAVPFLAVNAPPARAFMGDVGAVPLGFLAATFGIAGCRSGTWPWWFPLLVFLPFIADASTTLVRRLLRGEHLLEAHRGHYYQRLHQLGAGHCGTLAAYGVLMAAMGPTALAALAFAPDAGGWALGAWAVVMAAFFAAIDYHWGKTRSRT